MVLKIKSHAKRGELARRKRLVGQAYELIEVYCVTGCSTIEDLRNAYSDGRFTTAEWLTPHCLPLLLKHGGDLSKRQHRKILNQLARDYEQKILKVLAENEAAR